MHKSFFLLPLLALLFWQPKTEEDFVLVAAGDISCPKRFETDRICQGKRVYKAMPEERDAVLALGDLIQKGTPRHVNYKRNFFRTWPAKPKELYPVPGNHDYRRNKGNRGYRTFLKSSGIPNRNRWYDWEANGWQMLALDSNCNRINCTGRQLRWLIEKLQDSSSQCTLAYFHHPYFHGRAREKDIDRGLRKIWQQLDFYGVDIILNGHQHYYERIQPPNSSARQFIVGTGGAFLFQARPHSFSEAAYQEYGFLELHLREKDYHWQFVDREGTTLDGGEDNCA